MINSIPDSEEPLGARRARDGGIQGEKHDAQARRRSMEGDSIMNRLTQLIKKDMKPALGVTEPGAIAFAAAKARSYTNGPIVSVMVSMNSGMYKNAVLLPN